MGGWVRTEVPLLTVLEATREWEEERAVAVAVAIAVSAPSHMGTIGCGRTCDVTGHLSFIPRLAVRCFAPQPTWWGPGPGSGWKRRKRRRTASRRRGATHSESDSVLDGRSHNSRVESSTARRGHRDGGGRGGLGRLNDISLRVHDAVIGETDTKYLTVRTEVPLLTVLEATREWEEERAVAVAVAVAVSAPSQMGTIGCGRTCDVTGHLSFIPRLAVRCFAPLRSLSLVLPSP